MDNRANRIAKSLRAKARRKRIKALKRIPKREDFRQKILAKVTALELAEFEGGK